MTSSPARLNIPSHTPIDDMDAYPNPDGRGEVQISSGGRSTEIEAELRMAYGDVIAETYNTLYANGQLCDTRRMLMCSRCNQWKLDHQFERDRTRKFRRGRSYYCKACRAKR